MRFTRSLASLAFALTATASAAHAQAGTPVGSQSQPLDITVQAIDNITLGAAPGAVTLTSTAPQTASSTISYETNSTVARKIAVKLDVDTPGLTITVAPTITSGVGTAAGSPVTLTATDADLITGIASGTGAATLDYSVSATMAVPPAPYNKTVTYTLLAP